MFHDAFSHYLSYGATDQQTVRELAGQYDGLLVPGTVAAFQREGTGGFVLTLSAAAASTEYVIDPRFPLFQQALPRAKRSHIALAELLGWPGLVSSTPPAPADFDDERVQKIARGWAEFNGGYRSTEGSKFSKYAKRLGQPVQPKNARDPLYVLAPYFVAHGTTDPWWERSCALYEATATAAGSDRCIRVVASEEPSALEPLISETSDERLAVWVSGLDEFTSTARGLGSYGTAIRNTSAAGRSIFALYGGFFSILLQNVGLGGSSHGIGYGEYRNWIELPESGPPPARYYLPQIHRYVQTDEAARLYFADERLAVCECAECGGEPPLALDYHALMRHSVRCRAAEIEQWAGLDEEAAADRLDAETRQFRRILHTSGLADLAIQRAELRAHHLATWSDALRIIGSES